MISADAFVPSMVRGAARAAGMLGDRASACRGQRCFGGLRLHVGHGGLAWEAKSSRSCAGFPYSFADAGRFVQTASTTVKHHPVKPRSSDTCE
jgi:hypothetical protein